MKSWLVELQQHLSRQYYQQSLPHALIISGVKGTGKQDLAKWLVNTLLCQTVAQSFQSNIASNRDSNLLQPCLHCKNCQLFSKDNYPDHLEVRAEKNTIGVDSIRHLNLFLQKKSQLGWAQTVIIHQAQDMTVSAANALLKTLEEPTQNSFILLLSDQADVLLPTIISRCQRIEIKPPVGQALLAEFDQPAHDNFVNLSDYPELTNQDSLQALKQFTDNVHQFLAHHQQRALLLSQLVEQPSAFRWLEKIMVNLMRGQYGWCQQTENNSTLDKNTLWKIYTLVQSANKQIKTLVQANKQYVCEKLLVDIKLVQRKGGD